MGFFFKRAVSQFVSALMVLNHDKVGSLFFKSIILIMITSL